jgi:hypothetical protein
VIPDRSGEVERKGGGPPRDALEFRVEIWDAGGNRVEVLVALCSNSLIAKGAYGAALKLRPGANLVLSHRARIVAQAGRAVNRACGAPGDPKEAWTPPAGGRL